ncbi:MAG: hypothetical protein NC548_63930, partial [Lachnospiraceae bacterium]|nr:hypothetical protein [Lachnospiraceae bacterium]
HDFACTNPADMQYKILAERARYLKESKEGQKVMCKAMEEMRKDARQEADIAARKKAACRMIKAGKLSYEEIAVYQDFTVEEVEELADEISGLATV